MNNLASVETEQSGDDKCDLNLFNLFDENNENCFKLELRVNEELMEFEIDTGASVSVISEKDYEKRLSQVKLERSAVVLKSYDGAIIKPVGQITVNIKNGNEKHMVRFQVIKNGGRPLLGRDILKKINLKNFNTID